MDKRKEYQANQQGLNTAGCYLGVIDIGFNPNQCLTLVTECIECGKS